MFTSTPPIPPCTHKIEECTSAAKGNQSKTLLKFSQTLFFKKKKKLLYWDYNWRGVISKDKVAPRGNFRSKVPQLLLALHLEPIIFVYFPILVVPPNEEDLGWR